jgi:arylsulfatase
VVVVLLDDVGFAQLGSYGSSIATPNMDALARQGIRYTNFHVTALCSPTRACLMTGRNHHAVGMGFLAAFDTGFPSYRGEVTLNAATLPEMLRDAGYGTYAAGKWHLTPPLHMTPAGPFHQWPTGRGFDRYYGFLWGEDDQYHPELYYDQHRVDPPPAPDYHLSEDLVQRSEEFLADHMTARPEDPFFLYLSFGACHAPHQAPRQFIDAYRGKFDAGWDVERERVLQRQIAMGIAPPETQLAPRNPGVRPWAELGAEEERLYARMQEVFAGFMTHTDAQVGRLVNFLERYDALENTVILVMSDNGASGEGGSHGTANEYRWMLGVGDTLDDSLAALDDLGSDRAHNHYPTGWAQAGNTPGKYYKRFAYAGGVRAPLIVHWPAQIDASNQIRTQFHHAIDILPTILEVCGVRAPQEYRGKPQMPVHGVSMVYSFGAPDAATTHTTQYFETAGHRGIYADGWKAIAAHRPGDDFDNDTWELYYVAEDISESTDLAQREPEKLEALKQLWWSQAKAYDVLPLDDRVQSRMGASDPAEDRSRYVMLPGSHLMHHIPGPSFSARPFSITAEIERTTAGDDGVLLAWGRRPCGMSFFVKDGELVFDYNLAGTHTVIRAPSPIPLGPSRVQVRVDGTAEQAEARLVIDDVVHATGELPGLLPGGMGTLSVQCGYNAPSAVSDEYASPFPFTGRLHRVIVELEPKTYDVAAADWRAAIAGQ